MSNLKDLSEYAGEAARLTGGRRAVGNYVRTDEEEPGLRSYIFESTLRGYVGWFWSVTIYQPEGQEPTISEVVMMPGDGALVAPKWIPWSERLADYKALQAELEAQAAAEAAEAADAETDDVEAEDEDDVELDEDDIELVVSEEEEIIENAAEELLAATEFDVEEKPEEETNDAGSKPPRFFSWKNRRKNKKSN
jgi:NACalpha-BTF3-like transcription factor